MTILYLTRWLAYETKADYGLIDNSLKVEVDKSFIEFLYSEENPYKKLPTLFRTKRIEFHTSTKAGPNGPAMMSSLIDINAMEDDYKTKLIELIKIIDPRSVVVRPLQHEAIIQNKDKIKVKSARKINELKDKEGKTRLIAITDY